MYEDLLTGRDFILREAERRASLDWDQLPSQRKSLFATLFRRAATPLTAEVELISDAEPAASEDSLQRAA